jgi:hypothetical protein
MLITLKNPFKKLRGYTAAFEGQNGLFCIFDRSQSDSNWTAVKHRWLVREMPDGASKTVRTEEEARVLAETSAETSNERAKWWV